MHVLTAPRNLFNDIPARTRLAAAGALLALALLAMGFAPRSADAQAPYGRPDLVVRSFGLVSWGTCLPGHAVYTFQVTVGNAGTAPSPAIAGTALVQVRDLDGSGWGNGVPLPAIMPGGSVTVFIPVYYLAADPVHMVADAPHPFRAMVDPLHLVAESNEWNNASAVIKVGAPLGCQF